MFFSSLAAVVARLLTMMPTLSFPLDVQEKKVKDCLQAVPGSTASLKHVLLLHTALQVIAAEGRAAGDN